MITKFSRTLLMATLTMFILITNVNAAGLLKPANGSDSSIILKSHDVNVTINNGFSRTEVDQIFHNSGSNDLEAVYSFPVPKDASLSELSLWIDENEIIGEVLEKQKARNVYNKQRSAGRDTAIAEKNSYKSFEVSVAPVRAGKDTRVRLVYYQPLTIDLNIGRYVYPLEEGNTDHKGHSFWAIDDSVKESFNFNLELKSAYPVKNVRVPGYENKASVSKDESENKFNININSQSGTSLSKDIVFYYRLEDETPARVELIPFRSSEKDGTFMVVITPGGALKKIDKGTDWTFVLDTSGSMNGPKIKTLAEGVAKTINNMREGDRFRIITFNSFAKDYSRGYVKATRSNILKMAKRIKTLNTGGSTALYAGLEMAYKGFDPERTTGIILVTDGVANDGPSNDIDIIELHRKHDIRIFSIIVGNSANNPLLERLSKDSGGFSMSISTCDDIIGKILQAKAKLTHECLYNTEVKISGVDVKNLTPVKQGNLYQGQQVVMFGQYEKPGDITIKLTGQLNGEQQEWVCDATLPETAFDNPEIERLWALSAIKDTMEVIQENGESEEAVNSVTTLGTDYSLVTNYTSMVVINDDEAEEMGLERKNAKRAAKERLAQNSKSDKPADNKRVDNKQTRSGSSRRSTFRGSSSSGLGSGPVGPFFAVFALITIVRRKKQ